MAKVFFFGGCNPKDIDSAILNENTISDLRQLLRPARYTPLTITPLRTACGTIKLCPMSEVRLGLVVYRDDNGKILGSIQLEGSR